MNNTPFTFDEATEICEDFEDLINTEFTLDTKEEYVVEAVVPCPFAEPHRSAFMEIWGSGIDPAGSYTGKEYDVLVVAALADEVSVFNYISIRSFITEKGITYNFPGEQHH